ncbi:MAG: intradiol ring-cleavage dioxygenase [Pirellulaceae bacterium]|nr:intradiol ring-cleavage dioxygenase [Pirellulaceae bacterium]
MHPSRRTFLASSSAAIATGLLWTPGAMAERLITTPKMTEGPFYPDRMPLDTDNDLLMINDSINPGVGEVTHLSGRILTANGSPVRNAVVEIWQVDGRGVYLHSQSSGKQKRDANFQGFGRFLTDSKGQYYFRTVKPVPYPGRTPHIHFAINHGGKRVLTTQMLIKGHPQNERDGLFQRIKDSKLRETITADFKPIADSKIGELAVNFDLVLGITPAEKDG